MQLGEARPWNALDTAVRSDLDEVLPPDRCGAPGLVQSLEPLFIQAPVPELSVEALDVAVPHRPAWLDWDASHAIAVRPGREGAACEFRTTVDAGRKRVGGHSHRRHHQQCMPRGQRRPRPDSGQCGVCHRRLPQRPLQSEQKRYKRRRKLPARVNVGARQQLGPARRVTRLPLRIRFDALIEAFKSGTR